MPVFLVLLAFIALFTALPGIDGDLRAESARRRADVMPLSEVRPKMKGYGLTVFQGTRPERFDVEVIDVLKRFLPKQDLILIRTSHPRLEIAKVVAGMSGSPIYIDGKMIGAYAYGWQFPYEPVAGVTPIENMLAELDRPLPKQIHGWPLFVTNQRGALAPSSQRAVTAANAVAPTKERYQLFSHADQVHARAELTTTEASVRPVRTPLLLGGLMPAGAALAERLLGPLGFEPMQAGGGGGDIEPDAPKHYVDGGAIGVQLVSGDISAMGLGTVTRVEGDRLIAFGHPMMQAGITALPTSIARVSWFLASELKSFKMGAPVRPLGALVADRQASIVVSESLRAPVIPVRLTIRGIEGISEQIFRFEVAHDPFLSPSLMAMAIGSAIQSVTAENRDVTYSLKSSMAFRGLPPLTLEDFGVATEGMPTADELAQFSVVEGLGTMLNNPFEPVLAERVDLELELRYGRELLRLRGVELLTPEIDAGQPARLRLTLVPYAGPPVTELLEVQIPESFAGETVQLELVPGYAEREERPPAESLRELLRNLDEPVFSPRSVVVKIATKGKTLGYRGRVVKSLPPGLADTLLSTSTTITPTVSPGTIRRAHPLSAYMVGRERLSVQVRSVLR